MSWQFKEKPDYILWALGMLMTSVTLFSSQSLLIHGNSVFHTLSLPFRAPLENIQPLHLAPNMKGSKFIHFARKFGSDTP